MEDLQQKVSETPTEVSETKPQVYQGLNLVESTDYNGGTSIKYWM
tara:strand:+ start:124 stop:258 length:135 start_codon:yes stop_codon:yes gene_type:complete